MTIPWSSIHDNFLQANQDIEKLLMNINNTFANTDAELRRTISVGNWRFGVTAYLCWHYWYFL